MLQPRGRQRTDSAPVLVDSPPAYGLTLVGPVAEEPSWQARAGAGVEKSPCLVDWARHAVTGPAGQPRLAWWPNTYPQNGMVWDVRVARQDCTPGRSRAQCTKAQQAPRLLGLQARAH